MRDLTTEPLPLQFSTENSSTDQPLNPIKEPPSYQPSYRNGLPTLSPSPIFPQPNIENVVWMIIFGSIALGIFLSFRTF